VDLSKLAGREIRVRAGEPIRVDVPVTGSPPPVVSWQKEKKSLEPSDRVSILHSVDGTYILVVHFIVQIYKNYYH